MTFAFSLSPSRNKKNKKVCSNVSSQSKTQSQKAVWEYKKMKVRKASSTSHP